MVAFIQACGLESPGGGAKILRSLVAGRAHQFHSICTSPARPAPTSLGPEWHVPSRPYLGRFEGSRITPWLDHVCRSAWEPFVRHRMSGALRRLQPKHAHLLAHTDDFWMAFQAATAFGIPVTLAIHDDFSYNLQRSPRLAGALQKLEKAWQQAARRIVISEPMGRYYSERWGSHGYEVVTDSIESVVAGNGNVSENRLRVYFMGSLHLSYHANFGFLMKALRKCGEADGRNVKLTLRGGGFTVPEEGLATEVLPWGDEATVAADMSQADLLYLPLPFDQKFEAFVRLSLSTKLVTYLASGVPILYHGPAHAAAAELLASHDAALLVTEPGVDPLLRALRSRSDDRRAVAEAAGNLARGQFQAAEVRRRFWAFYDAPSAPGVSH